MQCTQCVSGLSRDGHCLIVDSDALNLTELGQGFVRRRNGDGLGVDGDTVDTLDGSQRLHGVSGDGHLLAFQSDALDLTELRLGLVIRCDGDGLFVDSDTLNLTQLGQCLVRRCDGNCLGVDGDTVDTLDGSQRLHGVSGDGHLLAFQSDALDLTELRLGLVIRCDGDGLFVDSDTLNLTQLGQCLVRRCDRDGLWVDGYTLDALQSTQCVSGLSGDGHCLIVDSDTLNLTQLG